MHVSRRSFALSAASLLSLAAVSGIGRAFDGPIADIVQGSEDFAVASDAYVFGYPLVTMEMTRRIMSNVAQPEGTRAPMGTLIKLRQYPDATFRDVTAPNADTLYTTGFFDVGDEPWVLHQPEMGERYFLLPLLSGWTEVFAVPGTRTTGGAARTFLITGPGWSGSVPDGMTELKSPTSLVWLLGRIYCTGTAEDYAAVHALQDAFKLQPLSTWGEDYTPPAKVDPTIDMKTPVRDQVNALSARDYFALLTELMEHNPPAAADLPALDRFAKAGLVLEKGFAPPALLDDAVGKRLPKASFERIMLHFLDSGGDMTRENGWSYTLKAGTYGTNYLQRALIAAIGLGANRPQDAVYPTSLKPSLLEEYNGAHRYTLRFEKGQLPPVRGFWSLTMYDEGLFFVANPINRYSMSMRTNPALGEDGSLTIYIQNESPGPGKEANWLPAPKGKFHLMMRLYWPDENPPSVIDGSWKVPAVSKV